jgi:hypothetical protein
MHSIRAIIALALTLTVIACGSDPTTGPDDGPGTSGETPGVGSTYRFLRFEADTTGQQIGAGDTVVTTVTATNAQIAGQSAVHLFAQGSDTVARIRYESNGDVLYNPGWSGTGWITLPIATKGTAERTIRDTTIDLGNGQTGRNRVTLTVSYGSSEQMTVGSESVAAHRIEISVVDVNPLSAELTLTITREHTVWYAPTLGYFTRIQTTDRQESPFSTIVTTTVSTLTAYDVK